MQPSPLNQLAELGQSIWYDNIQRSLLLNGDLARMIARDSITGLTSNPSIFDNAISKSADYDDALARLLAQDPQASATELYEALAISDIQAAADLMRPIFDRTNGADGYVSFEVSPTLAHDTQASIADARRLFKAVSRPNLMIKIPATLAGLPAIAALLGEGINVNATLMFSLQDYDGVAEAYLTGLEQLDASGGDVSKVASVASFFVSRVDTIFDKALEAVGSPEALSLRGQMGVANAKVAYRRFEETFSGQRFAALEAKGARVQRPLWASTSTKNPAYSDILYVEELIGPYTVNTMPPVTIQAFKDHGRAEVRLTQDVDRALELMERVAALGVDYVELTATLQQNGVAAFANSFAALLDNLAAKRDKILVGA
ncbi:MAG: transaldolase [Anaerolineae bacterium]